MKKILCALLLAYLPLILLSQTPDSFTYQAVVRDAGGNPLPSQPVGVQVTILQGTLPGTAVYTETHTPTTNGFGLINLTVGGGTVQTGAIGSIDWSAGPFYLNVSIDISGGTTYTDMGTVQLLSVPFALFAKNAGNGFSGDYNDLTNKPVLAGDVTGQTDANTVTAIQGLDVSTNAPANGQVLKWNNATQIWEPSDDQLGAAGTTDGVVTGAGITGTTAKTLTLIRSNGLGDITATFTDLVDDADADPSNEIQSLSLSGNDLTISGSNTVTLPQTTYTAGTGIDITTGTITNTAPDQTVTMTSGTGISVTGTYPDFTIANTQPAQTVTMTGTGATTVTGTYPNFTINSTDNNTTYTAGTGLTLTGTQFTHSTHSGDASGTTALTVIGIQGRQVTANAPANGQVLKWNSTNSRWELADDELGAAGTNDGVVTSIGVSGTTTKTITLTRSQSLPNLTATFTDEGSVYTAGSGIGIAGNTITNTSPDQTVTLTQGGSTTITGTYPNFTISSTDNNTTYTAGTGLTLTGTQFTHSTHSGDVTGTSALTVTGLRGITISSTLPTSGQVLKYNGTNWIASADNNSGGTVTSIATGNGITGGTITTTGTLGLTGQALSLHNLSTNGLIARTGSGTVAARTITGSTGISVANGDGVGGNPVLSPVFGTTAGTIAEGSHAHSAYGAAGTNGMVQYNDNGNFGATSNFFWDNPNVRLGVGTSTPTAMMEVKQTTTMPVDGPLFEVKNRLGQTVFIVYEDSVRIYVGDDAAKTNKGAFAVSGRNTAKQVTNDFFKVTPDSVRVYLDSASTMGGFAVKSFGNGQNKDYMSVYVDTAEIIDPSVSRVQWYPAKEAFLAGRVLVEDPDSVGVNSWATGFESRSIGNYSQALGYRARAKGVNSTAIGNYANAAAPNSFAIGDSAKATGVGSFALGSVGRLPNGASTGLPTTAAGMHSISIGMGAYTDTVGAVALGNQSRAEGNSSIAMGYKTKALGDYSIASGYESQANGVYSMVSGYQCSAEGYGVAMGNNCYAGEFSVALGSMTQATGGSSTASGWLCEATGTASAAFGESTWATGYGSFVAGFESKAEGEYSTAFGHHCYASGDYSFASGDIAWADGPYAFAFGNDCQANGTFSYAFGQGIYANAANTYAIALNNQTGTIVTQPNTMTIMGGKVGIGTISPSSSLEVVGVTKSITATGTAAGAGQFQSSVTGTAQGQIAAYSFYPTFQGTADNGPRRAADVSAGFNGGAWGTEYMAFNVGYNGASNDAQNFTSEKMRITSSGNVGVGNTDPNVKMDISGGIALRHTDKSITTLTLNNYNIGTGSYFRLTASVGMTITGISGGVDGKMLILTNVGTTNITLAHLNAGSNAANQFYSSTGANITVSANHTITLIYDSVSQVWRDIALR